MKKWLISVAFLGLLLTGCGQSDFRSAVVVTREDTAESETGEEICAQLLENAPVSQIEGEPLSPDGAYEVRTEGTTETCVSGVRLPEVLRVIDTATGEVMWEDMGYLWQSALWSPDGKYLALAYAGRTWNQVLIFETETWTNWQFTLPDGSAVPEYSFLTHEDWGTWIDENTICLTVGQGGDSGEQRTYRCSMLMEDCGFTGSVLEQTTDVLEETYDFNHDGEMESVEIVTLWSPELLGRAAWYELQVKRTDRTLLWEQDAAESHVGWTSIFVLELNGKEYLLRYSPWMGQGNAYYNYQIFFLDENGQEALYQENGVEFDINFGSPIHQSFDAADIATFLEEVHGYLDESILLLSTEGGTFRTGGSGAEFREDACFWDEYCPYDGSKTLEENLRAYENFIRAAQGAA